MHYLKEFVSDYLKLVASNYGGDITVNQIRVLHFVSCHLVSGHSFASHSEICRGLGLPAATVTRAVGTFVAKGVLREETDPRDARRRRISFCEGLPGSHIREQAIAIAKRHATAEAPSGAGLNKPQV